MYIKYSRLFLRFVIVITILSSLSCEKNNPVVNGKSQLTSSESPVAVAAHWQKYITISGGQGSCSVKSVSDSSVVSASIDKFTAPYGKSLSLTGEIIGTAIIVVQDSARTAEIELPVTVGAMAAYPANVTVQVQRTQYVSLQGGTSPFTIDQAANSSIANVTMSGSFIYIVGVASGLTTLIVRDNANPPNKATISITVTPKPVLTTPGSISFSSTAGDFSASGILPDDIVPQPANSEGAGGLMYIFSSGPNLAEIIGYKKHSQNIVDIVAIIFTKSILSQGVLPIDSSQTLNGSDTALVQFVFGGDLNSPTADTYLLHSGTVTFTALSVQRATGTFKGSATLIRNNFPVAGSIATVTNGAFDVPMLQNNLIPLAPTFEQERIKKFAQQAIEKSLMKMKLVKEK